MRMWARAFGLWIARHFGNKIIDCSSGRVLGRGLLIPWRGKVHVIGLETPVRAVFLPQKRLTYWKQEIGFTTHPAPDFPNERSKISNGPGAESS